MDFLRAVLEALKRSDALLAQAGDVLHLCQVFVLEAGRQDPLDTLHHEPRRLAVRITTPRTAMRQDAAREALLDVSVQWVVDGQRFNPLARVIAKAWQVR